MKRSRLHILALILSIAVIVTIFVHSPTPVLYSPEYTAFTKNQTNPAALESLGQDRGEKLLPLMSDLLDAPGTIILNIEYGDMDIAERDLQHFRELSRSIDNLVINLDMSESEIEDFRRMNQKNLQIISELLTSTSRLDELNSLEIRFRDQEDPQMMTSITYEGESLRNKISHLYQEYLSQSEPLASVSTRLDLNTTGYELSQENFGDIVKRIENEQEDRFYVLQTQFPSDQSDNDLMISVQPAEGSYHDTIRISGSLSGIEISNKKVDLFIDTAKTSTSITNSQGNWQYQYRIESIPAGLHTAYAVYKNSTFSDIVTFSVIFLNTHIVLENPEISESGLLCKGTLFTDSGPLDGVKVHLLADNGIVASPLTDIEGNFHAVIGLSPGDHQIKAVFSDSTVPLSGSESRTYTVTIPASGSLLAGISDNRPDIPSFIIAGMVILGTIIAGYSYIHRKKPKFKVRGTHTARPEDSALEIEEVVPFLTDSSRHDSRMEEAFEKYLAIAGSNIREAVGILFSHLREEIGRSLPLRNPRSFTPRELCSKISGLPFFENFRTFIGHYEPVRYGNRDPDDHERDEIVKSFEAISRKLKGGDEN
ncbi:MAG TPA: hypothetical protein VMW63_01800 [Methanoregulaceae archaeon]|nr:hypothetical protein [Methanoregulaceae archaeon]